MRQFNSLAKSAVLPGIVRLLDKAQVSKLLDLFGPSLIFPTPSARDGSRFIVNDAGKFSGQCNFLWISGVSRNICCLEIS